MDKPYTVSPITMVEDTRRARWVPPVWLECILFFAVYLLMLILSNIIVLIPVLIIMFTSPSFLSAAASGDLAAAQAAAYGVLGGTSGALINLFATVATIGAVFIYCKAIQKRSWKSLGLARENMLWHYLVGCGLGVVFLALCYGAVLLLGYGESFTYNGFSPVLFLFMLGFMVQSFSEELLCRGYLMNSVASRSNLPLGIILNSVLFGALHLLNPGISVIAMVNLILYGVIFSLLALVTDNIWAASGMHFTWNFVMGNIVGGEVSGLEMDALFTLKLAGPEWITGGRFGIEGSLATTVFGVGIAVLLALKLRKKTANT